MAEELSKRIDDVHKRLDGRRADIDRRFDQVDRRFEQLLGELRELRAEMRWHFRWTVTTMVGLFGVALPGWMWVLSLILKIP